MSASNTRPHDRTARLTFNWILRAGEGLNPCPILTPTNKPRMTVPAYPWYLAVRGDDIEQGDLFEACPVYSPPDDLAERPLPNATFRWEERDMIVLSQRCDLVKGRE